MKFVRVHKLDSSGNDFIAGIIFIDDDTGQIKCHPEHQPTLRHLIDETIQRYPFKDNSSDGVDASEPEVFF